MSMTGNNTLGLAIGPRLPMALVLVILLLVASLISARAEASLLFTLQRVSDTEAIMTATGSAGSANPDFGYKGLELEFLLDTTFGPAYGSVGETGDFVFGTNHVGGWSVELGAMIDAFISFSNTDTPTGTAYLTVTGGPLEFSPIGTGADVYSELLFTTGSERGIIGRWEMVAPSITVPEPATVLTMLAALAGMGWLRCRGNA